MKKFIDWILDTKAGKFLFITVFDLVVFGILSLFIDINFLMFMSGGVMAALLFAIFDSKNKRWY